MYRHTANYEADYLLRTVLLANKYKKEEEEKSSREAIKYPPVPHAIFSYPQIGSVGMTEKGNQTGYYIHI